MADTLSAEMTLGLTWLLEDVLATSTIADTARLAYATSWRDGTANDQADQLWHSQQTLAASGVLSLDLTNLSRSVFGGSLAVSFAKVKALVLVNLATTSGHDLLIGGAGAGGNGWGAPFNNNKDAKLVLPADSTIVLVNRKSGWTVTNSSSDVLKIENPQASAITFKAALIGTTV
jgi:hypothetical protein